MSRHFFLYFIFFLSFTASFSQVKSKDRLLDSIFKLRELSNDQNIELQESLVLAERAIVLSKQYGKDSTILKSNKNLSYLYLTNNKLIELKRINFENLRLAQALRDSLAIANAHHILGYVYDREVKKDSAYYYYFKAVKVYKRLKDYSNSGGVLLNMANIQMAERDFIGGEINAIDAKKLIEGLPETTITYRHYG
ncbi:hypothetical protein N7U66_14730 [Lacinutrix neustonica]|uniref:Uncharacterized protein n=1 Tax=Lacinutrix neustonica TaxID=2980107 RepID=A0A9E8MUJ7_9FLAO|nr:hypothetical protein [Lacinutrix neustonica]WAC01321.1 hypothetical protein N7U66_14730 [Lacinutrix neustonica]